VAYLVALGAAVSTFRAVSGLHLLAAVAVADVAATAAILVFSVLCRNSSLYDPYWSVSPIAISLFWALHPGSHQAPLWRKALVVTLVVLWGVRLTYNWARQWQGLHHEDWRYGDIRAKTGRAYWLASALGIHLFPTVQVFLGCLALYPALFRGKAPIGVLDGLALVVTLGGIAMETVADRQLHGFVSSRKSPQETLATGLWAYSRHPNYFGEILLWWGLFLFGLAADPSVVWTVAGPLAITLMFVFASIPMIDRRALGRKPGYAEHMRRVPALIPWFPKR
jgi:steroid 5-alpha reductase family enzyme